MKHKYGNKKIEKPTSIRGYENGKKQGDPRKTTNQP